MPTWMRGAHLFSMTTRVRVAFSTVNFVFPLEPDIRPIARPRCSPPSVFTETKAGGEGQWVSSRVGTTLGGGLYHRVQHFKACQWGIQRWVCEDSGFVRLWDFESEVQFNGWLAALKIHFRATWLMTPNYAYISEKQKNTPGKNHKEDKATKKITCASEFQNTIPDFPLSRDSEKRYLLNVPHLGENKHLFLLRIIAYCALLQRLPQNTAAMDSTGQHTCFWAALLPMKSRENMTQSETNIPG